MKSKQLLFTIAVLLVVLCVSIAFAEQPQLKQELSTRALRYFLDNANPQTGLVQDRASNFGYKLRLPKSKMASIAATGFGIAVLANAAERNLIPREVARKKILRTLRFLSKAPQYKGWFYHFMDSESGERFGGAEISTVDTGWLLAGALYAGSVFSGEETENLADKLYRRVDFRDMMTDGGKKPAKRTLSMGWSPEEGYILWQWDSYAEQMLLLILGLGHPNPLPKESWVAWARPMQELASGETIVGASLPLFAHQYSQLFLDLREKRDGEVNYFENSKIATKLNRETCAEDPLFTTFKKGFWGLSATDSAEGYDAFSPSRFNGTACLPCALASAMFDENEILDDGKRWLESPDRGRFWGNYGFADSLNFDENWFDPDAIGITVGSVFLSLANTDDSTSVWNSFQRIPFVERGLESAFSN